MTAWATLEAVVPNSSAADDRIWSRQPTQAETYKRGHTMHAV